jgi:hypothetical protein
MSEWLCPCFLSLNGAVDKSLRNAQAYYGPSFRILRHINAPTGHRWPFMISDCFYLAKFLGHITKTLSDGAVNELPSTFRLGNNAILAIPLSEV